MYTFTVLSIGVKLMPITDCPDNLTLDNLIDGEQFLTNVGFQVAD